MNHRSSIIAKILISGLVFFLFYTCGIQEVSEPGNGGSSVSPYSLLVEQADGSQLTVLGKGSRNNPYTETLDGYTVLRNKEGIYEYATVGDKKRLEPGGLKANDAEIRTRKERKYLKTVDKHLRNPD